MQAKAEAYATAECSETAAALVTKKEHDAHLKESLDKLNGIYKGTGGLLAYDQVWHAVLVDWSTGVVERVHTQSSRNMKDQMQRMSNAIYKRVYQLGRESRVTYIMFAFDGVAIHCSDGKFTEEKCRMLLGWATSKYRIFLPSRELIDRKLPASSEHYRWVGYFHDTAKSHVVKVDFQKDAATSRSAYEAEWKTRKYSHAVLTHTANFHFEKFKTKFDKTLAGKNLRKDWDAASLIIEYAQQELELFTDAGTPSEAAADLETVAKKKARVETSAKLVKEFYKGKNERLKRQEVIAFAYYNKRTHRLGVGNYAKYFLVKNGLTAIANSLVRQIWNQRYYEDYAYMIIARSTGPLMCVDGKEQDKLDHKECRIMMGYSLRHQRLLPPKDMVRIHMNEADEAYQYVGYYKDLRAKEPKPAAEPLGSNYNVAVQKHRKFLTGNDREYTSGIIGHTARYGWWELRSNFTGSAKDLDIYELLAEYVQSEHEKWDEPCDDVSKCGGVL